MVGTCWGPYLDKTAPHNVIRDILLRPGYVPTIHPSTSSSLSLHNPTTPQAIFNMQPKSFIYRMEKMKETCESEGQSLAIVASHVAVPQPSNIASRMRVSAVCESDTRIVRTFKTISKKSLGISSQVNQRRTTRQLAASLEKPESSSTKDVPTTPTNSRSVSPRDEDEDEPPRSLKRKRQSSRILATPTNSAPSTPNHLQVSGSTTPDSTDVSRKNRSMRYVQKQS